ncbi:MAG TPA: DUF4198 domain-containing protein [Chitinophagaceae bacterium]|nr:DUF4198 domain-containing protein [Chitinophagaceae bacterium]
MTRTLALLALGTLPWHQPTVSWLQPDKFLYHWGETTTIRIVQGISGDTRNWLGSKPDLQRIDLYFGDTHDDLGDALGNEPGDSIEVMVLDEGTAMVTLMTRETRLPDSLGTGPDQSDSASLSDSSTAMPVAHPGSLSHQALWQYCLKTLFQVGQPTDKACLQQTSLALDIVPDRNPYSIQDGQEIPFTVWFMGHPLANAEVTVWNQQEEGWDRADIQSDREGRFRVAVRRAGTWMVSCSRIVQPAKGPDTLPHGYQGTCTWGYH